MSRLTIFNDISTERERQEDLKAAGKFTFTLADPEGAGNKPAVLGEEFGEVYCAALNAAGSSTDAPERGDLRKELIQLAACAVAWVEALDREQA